MANLGGRPLRFKTPEELEERIEGYFASCFEPVMHRVLKPEVKELVEGQREAMEDLEGVELRSAEKAAYKPKDSDYEWVQETEWDGKPVFRNVKPFTITGLAAYLDTSRQTLLEYEGEVEGRAKNDTRFADAIKRAKVKCEDYAETQLYVGKNAAGPIFNLKNNYGWKDRTEVEQSGTVTVEIERQKEIEKALDAIL